MNVYEYIAKVEKVVDGDTIDVSIDLGFKIFKKARLRLLGIDTPEIHGVPKDSEEYRAGMKAKEWLEDKLLYKIVVVRTHKTGKYGRYLAKVYLQGNDINEQLVELGLARRYEK